MDERSSSGKSINVLDGPPRTLAGNTSFSSACLIMLYSSLFAGRNSPLQDQGNRLSQVLPGRLKSHAAQSDSFTIESGCKRLVVIMFGYIEATSKWYIKGSSCRVGLAFRDSRRSTICCLT